MAKNFWLIVEAILVLATISTTMVHCDLDESQKQALNEYMENLSKNRLTLKNFRPNLGGDPVKVLITMYNLDVSIVSPESMDFQFDFYFRQKWNDSRLKFDSEKLGMERIDLSGAEVSDYIWRPDIFIPGEKNINEHHFPTFSDGNSFYRINSDGTVFYSHRLTVMINCANHIKYFPMDKPVCDLFMESYGSSTKDIEFEWSKEVKQPISSDDKLSVIGFRIQDIEKDSESISLSTGTYSRLLARFILKRNCCYYLINIYLPAILLVALSWMSFFFDPQQKHYTRILIGGITTLGITILMIGSIGSILPRFHSLTAIHVYLFVCFLMVLLAFIRSASTKYSNGCKKSYKVEQCQIIDGQSSTNRCSRIVFPIIFILFNIVYGFTLWFATK